VESGHFAADVSERDCKVDGLVGRVGDAAGTSPLHPLPIRLADLLRRIVEPRGHEQRPQADQERFLGRAPPGYDDRTQANVPVASASVPPAVARDEIVARSARSRV
jgi:hypothetical protein